MYLYLNYVVKYWKTAIRKAHDMAQLIYEALRRWLLVGDFIESPM